MAKTLIYHLYPIAWDSIQAMTDFIPRVKALGADYIWLSPLYPSPCFDHGYDVADYESIDPRYGDLRDFEIFVRTAHHYGLDVLMDLVINHTSTLHPWFRERPWYYYRAKEPLRGWNNLFDDGSAWSYDEKAGDYYLHLFHEKQADLAWFDEDGDLNESLANEFRRIVYFWLSRGVDGFRLDVPQAVNKNIYSKSPTMDDLVYGGDAIKVLNAIFSGLEEPVFLAMELIDPTNGRLARAYVQNTPVDVCIDMSLKNAASDPELMLGYMQELADNGASALELESHDSPRFPSASGMSPEDMIWEMFRTDFQYICLYQGQELGLKNPTSEELSDEQLLKLDAQTAMRHARGASIDELRPYSRANARVPISLEEYSRQEAFPDSYLNLTKKWVKRWKER